MPSDNNTKAAHTGNEPNKAQKVYIDPATGLPVSPPETHPVRNQTIGRSDDNTEQKKQAAEVFHNNGAVSVNIRDRFQSSITARIDCDGKLIVTHKKTETKSTEPNCSRNPGISE